MYKTPIPAEGLHTRWPFCVFFSMIFIKLFNAHAMHVHVVSAEVKKIIEKIHLKTTQ